jgi:hypothetical protein
MKRARHKANARARKEAIANGVATSTMIAPEPEADTADGELVDTWLASIKLARYCVQIREYGYDSLKVLLDATEADILEMSEDVDVSMKKPHRRTLLLEWKVLKSSSLERGECGVVQAWHADNR